MKQYVDVQQTNYNSIKLGYIENGKWTYDEYPVNWWFGIKKVDYPKVSDLLQGYKTEEWSDYIKIYCGPRDPVIATIIYDRQVPTFEDDLNLSQRFWLDHPELKTSEHYRTAYFDIEVIDRKLGLEIGKGKITSIAIKDKDTGDETFFCVHPTIGNCKNEKELLIKFLEHIKNYDLISSWNGMGYDIPYIRERLKEYTRKKREVIIDGKKVKSIIYGAGSIKNPELYDLQDKIFKRISHIDLMHRMIHAYRFDTHIRSFALDSISKKFLGRGKIGKPGELFDLFEQNPKKFKEYNLEDVRLLYDLDKQNSILDMVIRQASWCNVFLKEVGPRGRGLYKMLDNVILQAAHQRGILGPSPRYDLDYNFGRPYKSEDPAMKKGSTNVNLRWHRLSKKLTEEEFENTKYMGGYVATPTTGLHKNVYTFDFKSLYPTAIRSFNIGFNTLIDHPLDTNGSTIKTPANTYFIKNIKSVQAEVLEYLMAKRKEYKQKVLEMVEQNKTKTIEYEKARSDEVVVKELSNSLYGVTGKRDGRYFSKKVASSITISSQWVCKSAIEFCKLEGHDFVYADTDSVMMCTEKELDTTLFLKKYHKWLKIHLKKKWNVDESIIELEVDKYYKKFLLINKKVYSGRVLNQEGKKCDTIYTRGLDFIKSSVCGIASKHQEELVNSLLLEDHDVEYYKKWVLEKRETIFDNVKKEELMLHQKISKKFNEYKNKTLPIYLAEEKSKREGAMMIREIDYIVTGDRVFEEKVIDKKTNKEKVVKRKRQTGVELIHYDGEFSREYYWNRAILNTMNRVLKVVFPEVDWAKEYKI